MLNDLLFRIRATGETAAAFGKVKAEAIDTKAPSRASPRRRAASAPSSA